KFLPYLFEVNEIMVQLEPYGWHMKDSRQIKREYGMPPGSRIHGSLTNTCGEEYGFYVLETDTEVENLLKIIQEISTLSDRKEGEPRIPNVIIFAKGQDSIDHFISWANNERRNYK